MFHHVLEIGTIHQENQKYFVDNMDDFARGIVEVATLSSLVGASITNAGTFSTGVQGSNPGGNTVQANTLNNLAGGIFWLGGVGDTGRFGYVNNAGSITIARPTAISKLSSAASTARARW